jgi:hypothetical protein
MSEEPSPAPQTPLSRMPSDQAARPAAPEPAATTADLAADLLARIERGSAYARSRKNRFRYRSSAVKVTSLCLSVAATIILGLQQLTFWTGLAFSLVAVVTVVNTLEPFFAWRSLWVLMENTQAQFYRLENELNYYLRATPPGQLEEARIKTMFDEYQRIWDQLGGRWMEYRRASGPSA